MHAHRRNFRLDVSSFTGQNRRTKKPADSTQTHDQAASCDHDPPSLPGITTHHRLHILLYTPTYCMHKIELLLQYSVLAGFFGPLNS